MAIQEGDRAPDFTLYSDEKEPFTLSDHEGKKNVLLLFYPGAFTSVCTTELNMVNNELEDEWGNDTQVVGISTDSPFAQAAFKKEQAFNFPLLSDHDGEVSNKYGAKYDHNFTGMNLDRISKRAAFLIDKEGTVRYAEVLENAGNLPDFDAIKSVHESLT